jgi:VCBS repeat-containing protein
VKRIRGTRNNDTLIGTDEDEFIDGFYGHDYIDGGAGDDRIVGNHGDDHLAGGEGRDQLIGGEGNDVIMADTSDRRIDGGAGVDTLGINFDFATGAIDFDVTRDSRLAGITVQGIERVLITTGSGDDRLVGGDFNDMLQSINGDDVLTGGGGDDELRAGFGEDTAIYSGRLEDYYAERLADGVVRIIDLRDGSPDGSDLVHSVERFVFSDRTVTVDELLGRNPPPPDNLPPTAAHDAYTFGEDDAGQSLDILANDSDIDGDPVTLVSIDTSGLLGRAVLNADGTVSYALDGAFNALGAGQTATDIFTYTVRDPEGLTSTARVTVTIVGANDGPVASADTAVLGAGGSILVSPLLNDLDPDADDTLTLSSINLVNTRGTAQIMANNQVRYDSGDAFRSLRDGEVAYDSFTYTVIDQHGALATSTVTIEIRGANDAPDAVGESFTVGKSGVANLGNLLANDSDPDGDPISLGTVQAISAQGAIVTVRADGTVAYDPGDIFADLPAGETATDSFTYTVVDSHGAASTATVNLTVNGGPAIEVEARDSVFEDYSADLINDEIHRLIGSFGPDAKLVGVDTTGTRGTVTFDPETGLITYTADDPSFDALRTGDDPDSTSFLFIVESGDGSRHYGRALLTVYGENDAPVAADDHVAATEGQVLDLWSTMLANDHDAEGEYMFLTSVDQSSTLGRVEYDLGIGALRYYADTPELLELDEGETVVDSFTYTIDDYNGVPSTATVYVTVTGTGGAAASLAFETSAPADAEVAAFSYPEWASSPEATHYLAPELMIA